MPLITYIDKRFAEKTMAMIETANSIIEQYQAQARLDQVK